MTIEVKISVKPIDYIKSVNILEQRVHDVSLGKKDELLWILEHNPVYTAGTSSRSTDLLDKNINVIKTNRGGKHTYHGPGQKIVYFVLNLNKREKDIRKLINKIENCIIDILNEYKIRAYPDKKNIGIWVGEKNSSMKIAAIGIRVKKWIAYHGFSINVYNDLSKYKRIIPCGIKNKDITSLKKLGIRKFNDIEKVISENFLNIFL
jgi:lipoyl(octanoyl) transferase|tara:strand:+ start:383 stop:1000 length:618 start_codon:yes stop_codon:yes gene_type:complete